MKQNKNLYFIPILARAYEQPNRRMAFRVALEEIFRLGKKKEYQKGFEQFIQFLTIGIEDLPEITNYQGVRESLLKNIKFDTEQIEIYKKFFETPAPPLELELYKEEQLISSVPFPGKTEPAIFHKIEPGDYVIRLSNGRVIWKGKIETKDVVWKHAFPHKAYPVAAATEKKESVFTKSVEFLGGEIILKIHPGLESGRISLLAKTK
jgi:hypothetical protein